MLTELENSSWVIVFYSRNPNIRVYFSITRIFFGELRQSKIEIYFTILGELMKNSSEQDVGKSLWTFSGQNLAINRYFTKNQFHISQKNTNNLQNNDIFRIGKIEGFYGKA